MLRVWTIYKHPKDYPNSYVARLFEVDADGPKPTASIVIASSLEFLREQMMDGYGLGQPDPQPGR
jgi:hypothetical protein